MVTKKKFILLTILFIILLIVLSLVLINKNTVKVNWINLSSSPINTKHITITFKKDNKSYTRKLIPNETDKIRISNNSKVIGNEHSSSYKLKVYPELITKDTNTIELYMFPDKDIEETKDSYIVKEKDNQKIYAYFIEAWDIHEKKNYYIVSKDHIINKPKIIHEEEVLLDNITSDTAFYINENQPLLEEYNGYIIKSDVDNSYVELSTLWDW